MTPLGNGKVVFATYPEGIPWVTDGTTAGTYLLAVSDPGYSPSFCSNITSLDNGKAVFQAKTGANGYELWVTDGTIVGTHLLKDIWAGTSSSWPGDKFLSVGNGKLLELLF
jgi:ELWxxDGT repeat protein